MRLRKLFEFVGDRFGISVQVSQNDGRQPIGRGIGPVLEAQDVMAVLADDPESPPDLHENPCVSLAFSNMTRACVGENRLHLNRSRVRRVHMATVAGGRGRRMKLISRGNIIC